MTFALLRTSVFRAFVVRALAALFTHAFTGMFGFGIRLCRMTKALICTCCFFASCIRATAAIGAYAFAGMLGSRFIFTFALICASCFFAI